MVKKYLLSTKVMYIISLQESLKLKILLLFFIENCEKKYNFIRYMLSNS